MVAAHYRKDNLLNCWTSSSGISGYHADFHEGQGTVGAWQGNSMGTACYVWTSLYNAIFLYEDATVSSADNFKNVVRVGGSEVLQQPPCSLDISPCDCDMIPKLNKSLRQRTISIETEDILTALRYEVAQIRRTGDVSGVRSLPQHWQLTPHQDYSESHYDFLQVVYTNLFAPHSLCMPQ